MDSNSWLLYVLLVGLILGGGYFAGAEIAFASCNKIRLKTQADAGDRRSKIAIYISEHFDNALTTLLIGNNIANVAYSSSTAALAAELFAKDSIANLVWSLFAAFLVLYCAEFMPKLLCSARPLRRSLLPVLSTTSRSPICPPPTML